ncbi:hypothetical protein Ga0100230_004500 [Opitutaceae bacterium TAV3]|nr:hypothetical protein Ga0100230_004500 [Opitutaceae bacterium TAV3]
MISATFTVSIFGSFSVLMVKGKKGEETVTAAFQNGDAQRNKRGWVRETVSTPALRGKSSAPIRQPTANATTELVLGSGFSFHDDILTSVG